MSYQTRAERLLNKTARWIVVYSVILSAWMFGSSEPWAYTIVSTGIIVAGCLWLFSLICNSETSLRTPSLIAVILGILCLVLFQYASIPASWVANLNPYSENITSNNRKILNKIDNMSESAPNMNTQLKSETISLAPSATKQCVYLFVTYMLAFLVIANCCRNWRHILQISTAILTSGFLLAVVGIVQKFSGTTKMLWFHIPRYGGNMFATFTNRNHYAFYANMLIGIALGILFTLTNFFKSNAEDSWRERIVALSTKTSSKLILTAFAAALIGASMCISLSRGGMISLLIAMGLVTIAYTFHDNILKKRHLIVAVFFLIIATVLWLGWQPVAERLETLAQPAMDPGADSRTQASIDTLNIFRACPIFGCGFGAFQYVFPTFQRSEIQFGRWLHAHNDWAQLLAEGGIIGGLLIGIAIFLFVKELRTRNIENRSKRSKRFIAGLMIGLLAATFHSFLDYSLHKPANALLLMVILGMAVASVYIPSSCYRKTTKEVPKQNASKKQTLWTCNEDKKAQCILFKLSLCITISLLILSMAMGVKSFRSELAFHRFEYTSRMVERVNDNNDLNVVILNAMDEVDQLIILEHSNSEDLRKVASDCFKWGVNRDIDDNIRINCSNRALTISSMIVKNAPSDYLSWLWMARSLALLGEWNKSDLCVLRSDQLAPPGMIVDRFPDNTK